MRRTLARTSILCSLVAALCAAVLLSIGNEGLSPASRGEIVNAATADQPLGDPASELLQSREFAGFVGGRINFGPLVSHAVNYGTFATIPWPPKGAEEGCVLAWFTQKLHSLYCVWIV